MRAYFLLSVLLLMAAPGVTGAQQSSAVSRPASEVAPSAAMQAQVHGRLLLVLPFENHSGQASLDWIGEGIPEMFNERLGSAGFLPIGRGDRLYALDHLGLPLNFQPSRAGTVRLAQTLDADYVVSGFFITTGTSITLTAQVLDVTGLKLGKPVVETAPLNHLLASINSLAWQVVKQVDPSYSVAESTFVAADAGLRIDTFENYVRGLIEDSPAERVRHLRAAVQISPNFYPAWLALGRAYFSNQEYDQAALAFGHLRQTDSHALEADFYRGLSYFYTGNYLKAEDAFAFDTTRLPLPEVVNNEAVAASRRGKDAVPLFQQAVAADPKDADYQFNLAIALAHRGDTAGALREVEKTLKLRPNDTEAQSIETQLKSGAKAPASASSAENGPLERIKRSYDEAGFRQAAFELEQMQTLKLATLPPAAQSGALVQDGTQFLNRGLLLEAEREFQAALTADRGSAVAYAGLAQIRERTGDAAAARNEAQKSLAVAPNVAAHLVLARLDLASNQAGAAAAEVGQALQVDPDNANARGMRQALEARGQQVP